MGSGQDYFRLPHCLTPKLMSDRNQISGGIWSHQTIIEQNRLFLIKDGIFNEKIVYDIRYSIFTGGKVTAIVSNEIETRIALVQNRVEIACARVDRDPKEITIIGVTKRVEPEKIAIAIQSGINNIAENYIQEAFTKIGSPILEQLPVTWHMIGHLQSNKVRASINKFALIHSVDDIHLAEVISSESIKQNRVTDILLEVKLDTSSSKVGIDPALAIETVSEMMPLKGIRLRGLMGIAPYCPHPEDARSSFKLIHELSLRMPSETQEILSMGMSGDFEIAIQEGATHIRIGTAIFGERQ